MTLQEKLEDLLVQATKERSHYYVANTIREVLAALAERDAEVKRLDTGWHEANQRCYEKDEQIAALKEEINDMAWAIC